MLQVMDWGPMRIPEPEAQLWAQAAGREGWTVQHGVQGASVEEAVSQVGWEDN